MQERWEFISISDRAGEGLNGDRSSLSCIGLALELGAEGLVG